MKKKILAVSCALIMVSTSVQAQSWRDRLNNIVSGNDSEEQEQTSRSNDENEEGGILSQIEDIFGGGSSGSGSEEVTADGFSHDLKSTPVEELAKKDIENVQTVSQVVGAAFGAWAAHELCGDNQLCSRTDWGQAMAKTLGVSLGVLVGGYVGESIGKRVADRRLEYASESEYLDSETAATEAAISARESDILDGQAEIVSMNARLEEIKAKESLTEEDIKEAQKLLAEVSAAIESKSHMLAHYDETLEYLNSVLETSKVEENATQEEIELWEKKYATMQERRDELLAQREQADEQHSSLTADQEELKEIVG